MLGFGAVVACVRPWSRCRSAESCFSLSRLSRCRCFRSRAVGLEQAAERLRARLRQLRSSPRAALASSGSRRNEGLARRGAFRAIGRGGVGRGALRVGAAAGARAARDRQRRQPRHKTAEVGGRRVQASLRVLDLARNQIRSLCFPQGSPAGPGHQSLVDKPQGFLCFFAEAPLQPIETAKARAIIHRTDLVVFRATTSRRIRHD